MKKYLVTIMAIIILASNLFIGCGTEEDYNSELDMQIESYDTENQNLTFNFPFKFNKPPVFIKLCNPDSEPNRNYVTTDVNTCEVIRFTCPSNQQYFSNNCGCGCELK